MMKWSNLARLESKESLMPDPSAIIINQGFQNELGIKPSDPAATMETIFLFYNLKKLSENRIILGHQDSTAYGVNWSDEPDRSDIKDVTGDYPGLYGWDFRFLSESTAPEALIKKKAQLVIDAYMRGGINSFSWHMNNPLTGGPFNDTMPAVAKILPGGELHSKYLNELDRIASFIERLVDPTGIPIPVIFRPFHEFNEDWFWWGKAYCSRENFIELWRITVQYLRDEKGLNNLLYAFSPDRSFNSAEEYLERYPGDDLVDIIGMENYRDFGFIPSLIKSASRKLQIVSSLAREKNKLAALTETGSECIHNSRWWTDKLLKAIDSSEINISYLMIWRNANTEHFFAPYLGHHSVENFREFTSHPKILLQSDLPWIYSEILTGKELKIINRHQRKEM